MGEKNRVRQNKLKALEKLTHEQQQELKLIELKAKLSDTDYQQYINSYLQIIAKSRFTFSLYDYTQLISMGYQIDEIVEKTISLSSDAIPGYESEEYESEYWVNHRRNSMSLYVCAMYAGVMLGHFSITPVLASEKVEFLQGLRLETEFTVMSTDKMEAESHYLYISAVAVREAFQNSSVGFRVMRTGKRLINHHLKSYPLACGYFAEAYSSLGIKLCEIFEMTNVCGNFFIRELNE